MKPTGDRSLRWLYNRRDSYLFCSSLSLESEGNQGKDWVSSCILGSSPQKSPGSESQVWKRTTLTRRWWWLQLKEWSCERLPSSSLSFLLSLSCQSCFFPLFRLLMLQRKEKDLAYFFSREKLRGILRPRGCVSGENQKKQDEEEREREWSSQSRIARHRVKETQMSNVKEKEWLMENREQESVTTDCLLSLSLSLWLPTTKRLLPFLFKYAFTFKHECFMNFLQFHVYCQSVASVLQKSRVGRNYRLILK